MLKELAACQLNGLRHATACFLIVLFALSIPLSTTATVILAYAVLAIWLVDKNKKDRWNFYFSYPLTKPIFIFIGISLLGIAYTGAVSKSSINSFYSILRLSFIPILAYYLHNNKPAFKKSVLYAFELALIITILCAFLKVYCQISIGHRSYGNDIFKNHIVISYFMAVALLFLWVELTQYKKQAKVIIIILMSLILYHLIFLNTGRIGYFILFLGASVLAWHKHRWKSIGIIWVLFTIMMLLAYQYSEIFSLRMNEVYDELILYSKGELGASSTSSIATRLEFGINSINLFFQHPIIGSQSSK
jgi:O-antigen ligase